MSSIHFTAQELLADFKNLAHEATQLQRSVEKDRWCGRSGLKREFADLQASIKEKEASRAQAKTSRLLSVKMDLQIAQAAIKTTRLMQSVEQAFGQKRGNWAETFSTLADRAAASPIGTSVFKAYESVQIWLKPGLKPGLNRDQQALVEQFVRSDSFNWELNQKIVQDIAVVKELIDRKAFLRRKDDRESSLLIALTSAYDPVEEFNYEVTQKNKSLLNSPAFRNSASRMKSKLDVLRLLFKTHKWTTSDAFHFYEHCLLKDCTLFLDYVKKNAKVAMTPEQQIDLWLDVKSLTGAQFLKEIGCDPNIRHNGRTPLLELAKRGYSYPLSAANLAQILMRAGADPSATTEVLKGYPMNAHDLTPDPYLKEVLRRKIETAEEKN